MIPTPSNVEVITVRINVGQVITVCTVYVPPNACYDYQASQCVLIVGDFFLVFPHRYFFFLKFLVRNYI